MRTIATISLLMMSGILAYAAGDAKAGKADYDRATYHHISRRGRIPETARQSAPRTFAETVGPHEPV